MTVEFKRTMEPWLRLKKNKTCFFSFGCWLLTLSKPILKRAAVLTDEKGLAVIKTLMTLRLSFKMQLGGGVRLVFQKLGSQVYCNVKEVDFNYVLDGDVWLI